MTTPNTDRQRLVQELLTAIRLLPGLRTAAPSGTFLGSRIPWDLDARAVDVTETVIEIRLIAVALPLPPLLRNAESLLCRVLEDTPWKAARLRLVVSDLDTAALTRPGLRGESDVGHGEEP